MPVTRIETDGLEIFDSGAVTVFDDASLEFTLEHEDDDDAMELVFEFVDDGGEPDLDIEVVDVTGRAILKLVNHSGPQAGPAEPFNVGAIAGRALHLYYRVNHVEAGDDVVPELTYTFYLGKHVDEDEVAG